MSNVITRAELNKSFLRNLKDDFEKYGKDVIEKVRISEPEKYLAIVAKLLPTELSLTVTTSPLDGLTPDELRILSARLAGLEKFLTANCAEIDAVGLPRELLAIHKDIIA